MIILLARMSKNIAKKFDSLHILQFKLFQMECSVVQQQIREPIILSFTHEISRSNTHISLTALNTHT